jgi:hypothetical protein
LNLGRLVFGRHVSPHLNAILPPDATLPPYPLPVRAC